MLFKLRRNDFFFLPTVFSLASFSLVPPKSRKIKSNFNCSQITFIFGNLCSGVENVNSGDLHYNFHWGYYSYIYNCYLSTSKREKLKGKEIIVIVLFIDCFNR